MNEIVKSFTVLRRTAKAHEVRLLDTLASAEKSVKKCYRPLGC